MEIRLKDIKLDYDSEQRKLSGYINVVERESETLYSQKRGKWFKETMKAGVFTRALQKNDAIPLLLEHDWENQLAHTSNGTLELKEDAVGLKFDAVVSDEVFKDIQQRNITSCSFGFRANEQIFEDVNPKLEKRYVTNIDLFEVSLVANPAYTGSLVEQRNLEQALKDMEETPDEVVVEEEVKDQVEEVRENEVFEEQPEEVTEVVEEVVVEEERTIDTTGSDVKADAKEVIQEVIEQTQADAEFYGEIAKDVEEYKEHVKECHEEEIQNLENESLYYTTLAYTKWLEVAKLKEINMNL